MISKFLKKGTLHLIFLIFTLFLFSLLLSILIHYVNSFHLGKAEEAKATVVARTAEKGLFQPPIHYVKVDRNQIASEDSFDGRLNRIPPFHAKSLEEGEEISGFLMEDNRFLTRYDLFVDNLLVIGILGMLLFIILVMIIFWKYKTEKRQKKKRRKTNRLFKRIDTFPFGKIFLILFFIVGGVLTSTFVGNSFHKIFSFGQIETDAVIVNKHSEREMYLYRFDGRLVGDPLFQFELNYPDENGEIHRIIKEVTHHTYSNYEQGDFIPISYRKNNVFDVFVRDTSFKDVLDIYVYWEFSIYTMILAIGMLVLLFAIRNRYKKSR